MCIRDRCYSVYAVVYVKAIDYFFDWLQTFDSAKMRLSNVVKATGSGHKIFLKADGHTHTHTQ